VTARHDNGAADISDLAGIGSKTAPLFRDLGIGSARALLE